MTILEYLRKLFRNDSELSKYDVSEGSNFYDLVYTTLDKVFNDSAIKDVIGWADVYNINNVDRLTYADLANIAAQYGIPAPYVNYSSGNVKLIFNSPVDVELPEGTMFSSNNATFMIMSYEKVLSRYLESNTKTSDGKYQSQPITVFNLIGQNAPANSLGLLSLSIPQLARIENDEINNGALGSDKYILASIIRAGMRGIASGTEESVTALMRHLCPDIYAVQVISGNDEHMTRDLMVNSFIYGSPAENEQSFFNKIYGNNTTNKNVAYKGTSSTQDPPDIDSLHGKTELSQYQYINLGDSEASALTISTDNQFTDTFTMNNNLGAYAPLDNGIVNGDTFIYSYGSYWIEPGSSLNLEGYDGDDVLHKMQVIVRDVVPRTPDVLSIEEDSGDYVVELSVDAAAYMDRIRPDQKIDLKWIRVIGETEFDLTVTVKSVDAGTRTFTFESSDPVVTGTCASQYPGKAIWNEIQIVGILNVDLHDVYASVPDNISTQIGSGWIVSEHGYPVGMRISDNEVYVENERVVLGGNTGSINDPMKDLVLKGGTGRFISAVLRSILVKTPNTPAQGIPVVNNEQVMDR